MTATVALFFLLAAAVLPTAARDLARFSFANETGSIPTDAADAEFLADAAASSGPVCRAMFARKPYQIMESYCSAYPKIHIYDFPYYEEPTPMPTEEPAAMSLSGKRSGKKGGMSEIEPDFLSKKPYPLPSSCNNNCHSRLVLESRDELQLSCGWTAEPLQEAYPLIHSATCASTLYDPCNPETMVGTNTYTMTKINYGLQGGYSETLQGMYSLMHADDGNRWTQYPYSSSMIRSELVRTPSIQHLLGGNGTHGIGAPLHDIQMGPGVDGPWYFMSLLHYCDGPSAGHGDCGVWNPKELAHLQLPVCGI